MKKCEFKLYKKNTSKILFITALTIVLAIIPNLIPINKRYSRISIDKKDSSKTYIPQIPKESSVYHSDTIGKAMAVCVDGDYAYLAVGYEGLAVIDISDPTNPGTPVYVNTTGYTEDVFISGDYAYLPYVSNTSGLAVIDISDPTNPGTPVHVNIIGWSYGIYVSGDYAYIARRFGLAVVDISNPSKPKNPFYENTTGLPYDVHVDGDYAYIANGDGLAVIDISNPKNPEMVAYGDTTGAHAYSVFVSGDYAYMAIDGPGLAVVNISDPTDPGVAVYENTNGRAVSVYVDGDYAYVADYDEGLAIIDISDPTNPGTPVYEDTIGTAYDVYIYGDYAYIADYDQGLAIIDISEPIIPELIAQVPTTDIGYGICVSGDYAYMATRLLGLAIINISNPTDPGSPIYRNTVGTSHCVFVSGNYAYVADEDGLAIIDISDPTHPGTPIYEATSGASRGVYVDGDFAYMADGLSGLAVINISDPTNPGTPVYENTNGLAFDVFISGDYAYVADFDWGLAIINISDPTNPGTPIYSGTIDDAIGVFVSGDYAYVALTGSGLAVIDISDPTNPGTPVYRDTNGVAQDLYVSGDFVYIADGSRLTVINISDPTSPGAPVEVEITEGASDVYVCGDYAYVSGASMTVVQVRRRIQTVAPIIINATSDFYIESGYQNVNISWTAIDSYPDIYTIVLQGFGVVAGPTEWVSGETIIYNVPEGLAVGEYLYTINFTDVYDLFTTHIINMTVQDTKDPIIINAPSNLTVETIDTRVSISWTATDPHPNTYTIELQGSGIVVGPSAWYNGTSVTYNVPFGLAVGEYIYTINFTDVFEHFVSHTVIITVQDTIDPFIIDPPSDFSVEFGYTGVTIEWTALDPDPGTYTIELQGLGIVAGPSTWFNDTPITYIVPDGFNVDNYIYTVNFTDLYDHFATHTVIMTVQDTIDPLITDSPDDFTIDVGYTGVNISWTVTDPHPNTYTIELQGVGVVAGPIGWSSGEIIIYNIPDGLAAGEYTYTINVTDNYGNFITNSVTITVKAIILDGEIPLELIILSSTIGGGVAIGVAVLLFRRRRKRIQ